MTRERCALLHPLAVSSLLVLVANDHWLKHTHPGVLSGKLSGFAAVLLLPLFLHALFELGYRACTTRPPNATAANRALAACRGAARLSVETGEGPPRRNRHGRVRR